MPDNKWLPEKRKQAMPELDVLANGVTIIYNSKDLLHTQTNNILWQNWKESQSAPTADLKVGLAETFGMARLSAVTADMIRVR